MIDIFFCPLDNLRWDRIDMITRFLCQIPTQIQWNCPWRGSKIAIPKVFFSARVRIIGTFRSVAGPDWWKICDSWVSSHLRKGRLSWTATTNLWFIHKQNHCQCGPYSTFIFPTASSQFLQRSSFPGSWTGFFALRTTFHLSSLQLTPSVLNPFIFFQLRIALRQLSTLELPESSQLGQVEVLPGDSPNQR